MPEIVYYNPNNPKQKYRTAIPGDPNIPAGWLDAQGLDGATPEKMKIYTAGVNNQGAGAVGYLANADGDPQQRIDQPNWPNGILNGYGGGIASFPSSATFQYAVVFYDDVTYDTSAWS
jgi:hypothetical protein